MVWPGWGRAFLEADLPACCLSHPSQNRPQSSLSLPTLSVEDMAWTMRQDCVVLADSSSRQRPRLPFVLSHFLDGGTRHQSGKALFSFSGALCLAGCGSDLEKLILPPGAFSLVFLALTSKARGHGRGPGPRAWRSVGAFLRWSWACFTAQARQVSGESGRGCDSAAETPLLGTPLLASAFAG